MIFYSVADQGSINCTLLFNLQKDFCRWSRMISPSPLYILKVSSALQIALIQKQISSCPSKAQAPNTLVSLLPSESSRLKRTPLQSQRPH